MQSFNLVMRSIENKKTISKENILFIVYSDEKNWPQCRNAVDGKGKLAFERTLNIFVLRCSIIKI